MLMEKDTDTDYRSSRKRGKTIDNSHFCENTPTSGINSEPDRTTTQLNWYVIRCTYGREKKACEYLKSQNIEVYCPTLIRHKLVDGHHRKIEESRLPNLFFAYDTFSHLKTYVYDNTNQETKSLRFYYQHSHKDSILVRQPVVVPTYQMDSLKKICAQEKEDILMVTGNIPQFNTGQTVRITEGKFKGVIGKVARYQGQQRVAVIIDGLFTAITAYVPSAFLKEE